MYRNVQKLLYTGLGPTSYAVVISIIGASIETLNDNLAILGYFAEFGQIPSFFCWGGDKNLWSSVITGNIEAQKVWHDIKRALFSSYLVSRYRIISHDQWISIALLKCCSQTSILKYQNLAIYYVTNGYYIITMLQQIS